MNPNDAMLYEYMMEMGAMSPEMEKLKRQQAQVEALRGAKMGMGTTVGSGDYQHYVPKGIAGAAAALGQNYIGAQQQGKVDDSRKVLMGQQREKIDDIRRRYGLMTNDIDAVNNAYFSQ